MRKCGLSPLTAASGGFDRFLADFLGAFLDALRQELGRVGDIGRGIAAGRHRIGEFGQDFELVIGHRFLACSISSAAWDSHGRHMALGLANRIGAEMKDRGGKHRRRTAFAHAFDQMIEMCRRRPRR